MRTMLLNTFLVDPKPGDEPPFPDVRGFAKVNPETAAQLPGFRESRRRRGRARAAEEGLVAAIVVLDGLTTRPPVVGPGP